MYIVGAGLAGLIAANLLRHRNPVVFEAQPALPNNHSAVLRFRTPTIGELTGIPFRRVTMIKTVIPYKNPVADALAYSFKNTGQYRSDRSIIAGTTIEDRWIAPPDFIERLAKNANIVFNTPFYFSEGNYDQAISTIPMPDLMSALNYDLPFEFKHSKGTNLRAHINNCEAYLSILLPSPIYPFSRVSVTGNEVIAEHYNMKSRKMNKFDDLSDLLGIPHEDFNDGMEYQTQKYGKINPASDDRARKDFIHWATQTHNIYSLGRLATWRPHLLLDDLVKDIRLIDNWSQSSSINLYAAARHR